jgi:hypothetical protein
MSSLNKIVHATTFLVGVLFSFNTYCQTPSEVLPKHTLFIELSSKGPSHSLNYDRAFYKRNNTRFTYRAGLHISKKGIGIPLSISLLKGKQRHFAEASLAITPYVKQYRSLFSSTDSSDKYIYILPAVGYRFQKQKGGAFFKVLAGPLILLDPPSHNFWKMNPKVYATATFAIGFTL